MRVPHRVGTKIIDVGKTTTMPTIIMGAAAEFSTMRLAARWFNAEHAICGATLHEIVHQRIHQSYYADGAVLGIMKMPSARNQE